MAYSSADARIGTWLIMGALVRETYNQRAMTGPSLPLVVPQRVYLSATSALLSPMLIIGFEESHSTAAEWANHGKIIARIITASVAGWSSWRSASRQPHTSATTLDLSMRASTSSAPSINHHEMWIHAKCWGNARSPPSGVVAKQLLLRCLLADSAKQGVLSATSFTLDKRCENKGNATWIPITYIPPFLSVWEMYEKKCADFQTISQWQ